MFDYKEVEKEAIVLIDKLAVEEENVTEKISQYRTLTHLKKEIDNAMTILKPVLIKENVNEYFLDDKEKIYIKEGAMQSIISPIQVYNELVERERTKEFFDVCTVTATNLNKIDDGKALVAMFKKDTIRKAGALKVDPMTAKDLKEAATKID